MPFTNSLTASSSQLMRFIGQSFSKGFYPNGKLFRIMMFSRQNRVNYLLDYTSKYLILSNLLCLLYFLFLLAKRPRKVDNSFNISHNFVVYRNCALRVVYFNAAKCALDFNKLQQSY